VTCKFEPYKGGKDVAGLVWPLHVKYNLSTKIATIKVGGAPEDGGERNGKDRKCKANLKRAEYNNGDASPSEWQSGRKALGQSLCVKTTPDFMHTPF
jgi:hypothetical protein